MKILVPFPQTLFESWTLSCKGIDLTVEEWCKKQLVERLSLLKTDDNYLWDTFFAGNYYTSVIACEEWIHGEVVSRDAKEYLDYKEHSNFNKAIIAWERWIKGKVEGQVEVIELSVPMDVYFHSILENLGSLISRTAEELCTILIMSVMIELLIDNSFYVKEFTEPLEDNLGNLDIDGLLSDEG